MPTRTLMVMVSSMCRHDNFLPFSTWHAPTVLEFQEQDNLTFFQALAVDMTARNLQDQVKKKGLPWSAAKGFDTFTPIG